MFKQETQKAKNNLKDFEILINSLDLGNHKKFLNTWTPKFNEIWTILSNSSEKNDTQEHGILFNK